MSKKTKKLIVIEEEENVIEGKNMIDEKDFLVVANDFYTNYNKFDEKKKNKEIAEKDKKKKNMKKQFMNINTNVKIYSSYEELINDKNCVTCVDLSNRKLSKLDDDFFDALTKLDKLIELKLDGNCLNVLSNKLFNCTSIIKLNLSNNVLREEATTNINKLINLEELYLSSCGDYSENIYQLSKLVKLDLSNNYKCSFEKQIRKDLDTDIAIPKTMFKLVAKVYFGLDHKKIFSDLENLTKLKNLKHLNISSCQLGEQLPYYIYSLTNLESLDISNNGLTLITEQIYSLSNLTYLNIDENYIEDLPENIFHLKKLETFKLCSERLKVFQPELWNIKAITELNLTRLKEIPKKNNDLDIKLTINSNVNIPNNIKRLILINSTLEVLDNIPFDVEELTIKSDCAVKLPNLPINLKCLTLVDVSPKYSKYGKKNEDWRQKYIDEGHIKVPFGCEIILAQNKEKKSVK